MPTPYGYLRPWYTTSAVPTFIWLPEDEPYAQGFAKAGCIKVEWDGYPTPPKVE